MHRSNRFIRIKDLIHFLKSLFSDEEQVGNLLQIIKENESIQFNVKSSKPPPKPKLTHVRVQNIDQEIAKNLAMYGNPLGFQIPSQNSKMDRKHQKTWIQK